MYVFIYNCFYFREREEGIGRENKEEGGEKKEKERETLMGRLSQSP